MLGSFFFNHSVFLLRSFIWLGKKERDYGLGYKQMDAGRTTGLTAIRGIKINHSC